MRGIEIRAPVSTHAAGRAGAATSSSRGLQSHGRERSIARHNL
jgi:hypothetical protein